MQAIVLLIYYVGGMEHSSGGRQTSIIATSGLLEVPYRHSPGKTEFNPSKLHLEWLASGLKVRHRNHCNNETGS